MQDRSLHSKSELRKLLDESHNSSEYTKEYLEMSKKFLEPLEFDEQTDSHRDCTQNLYRIVDPEAKHRLKMIVSGEEHVSQVRDIVNWPSSLSYRFKSLLGAILSPSFMMRCLRLPTFAFYSLEASLFLGIVLLPVFVLESVFYPVFRLVFGVLYPAYASYKAVRTRDVKKYVSGWRIAAL